MAEKDAEQTKIEGIDAVVLIVKDLEKQKKFYRDIMGFQIDADYGNEVFFKVGNQKFAIFAKGAHPEGDERLKGAEKGLSHLEFRVKKKNLEKIQKKLKEKGFHAYSNNYEDADGNLFHFNVDDK